MHLFLVPFFAYVVFQNLGIRLPKSESSIQIYSNRQDTDFEYLIAYLIKNAQKSISIHSYGFQSPTLLKLLEKRMHDGIAIEALFRRSLYNPKKITP